MKDSIKVALMSSSITGLFSLISTTVGLVLSRPQSPPTSSMVAHAEPEGPRLEQQTEQLEDVGIEVSPLGQVSISIKEPVQTQRTIAAPDRYPISNISTDELLTIGSITLFVGVATFFIVYMIKKWRAK